MITDGVSPVVLDQLPPEGAKLVQGGHVMAYTASSENLTPQDLVCVPDLKGQSDLDCARLLRQRGLIISMAGSGVCTRQSPAAGEYVELGSCVHVTLGGND